MDGPIASAVVLPDELIAPVSPSSNKRRQSSVSEDNAKRPRLDDDAKTRDHQGPGKPVVPVRRERGRERRLFGAALGALSQNSSSVAQKRRSEIEKRQQAQRKQEDEESEQRKAERIARRKEQRWREQKRFELATMRTRHENLRSMAHFLQTETEPHLYYKPWETTPSEDDRIQHQVAETEETIKRELEDYEARQQQDDMGKRDVPGEDSHAAEDSKIGKDKNLGTPQNPPATNGGTNGSVHPKDLEMKDDPVDNPGSEAVRNGHATKEAQTSNKPSPELVTDHPSKDDADDDENGEDVVEEAAEDTVIY
ncbi:hypothetical protein T440DRAFT_488195 [Plenodomus tracheiphilus IPT5]|uniref:Pinin/SDK/MemA protein domain-containing protein n=1 Tax=Plenodomus tracheiphilus IPT5 TaxID=1408161 RepID=A0A6A7BEN0_9PLEO|nr:hypothetical protein T440DRAFT_488195 [Plenodomus tracheiphilus IPT5]